MELPWCYHGITTKTVVLPRYYRGKTNKPTWIYHGKSRQITSHLPKIHNTNSWEDEFLASCMCFLTFLKKWKNEFLLLPCLTKADFCGRSNIFLSQHFLLRGQNLRKYELLIQFNLLVKLTRNFGAAVWNNNDNGNLTQLQQSLNQTQTTSYELLVKISIGN